MIVYSQRRICKNPNWAETFVDRMSHTISGADDAFSYEAVPITERCTANLSF